MRAQEALRFDDDSGWRLSPVPDVRDETVARFGAARYRTTFRSIRPLLDDDTLDELLLEIGDTRPSGRLRLARTRRELDEDARAFALGLIKRWIDDPSNVRLLRIGLDLWPDVELLREILSLLRPFTGKGAVERRRGESLGTASPKSCARGPRRRALWRIPNRFHRGSTLNPTGRSFAGRPLAS